jgi:hypothetical protein
MINVICNISKIIFNIFFFSRIIIMSGFFCIDQNQYKMFESIDYQNQENDEQNKNISLWLF